MRNLESGGQRMKSLFAGGPNHQTAARNPRLLLTAAPRSILSEELHW